ncbi:MAG TPA: hypothetical protein VJZ00_10060 [Thermoanaerobaculia bacterium]|nr:hypothetical protein [Thermoanaerobaculia bacterium]
MSADDFTLAPLLRRYPDARRANAPLLPPVLLPYIALMFGSAAAALIGVYNAIVLRRAGLAVRAVLIGIVGWLAFYAIIANAGTHIQMFAVIGRLVHFLCGGWMYLTQRPHYAGSQFLGGRALPLVQSYVIAFVLYIMTPSKLLLLMLGVPRG